ncbi:MAG: hypothetical protein RJA70_959 [Pseudomonadota bacterium]|jgi:23S rRNA pseudouridine1911/1915/1917 synthase
MQFKSQSFAHGAAEAFPLDRALRLQFASASWNDVRQLIQTGKVLVDGQRQLDTRSLVRPGQLVEIQMSAPRQQGNSSGQDAGILYRDHHLVVVNKPSGISSVDHEREETSLQSELRVRLSKLEKRPVPPLFVVHRLDKVTSGVMMFARSKAAQAELKNQFREHTTGRFYTAVAHGAVHPGTLRFRIVRDRGDGTRGVTRDPNIGTWSVTHVTLEEQLEHCSVIRCQLETGRTHQIRIHLSEIGHPLVGEPLYTQGFSGPWLTCARTLLHAQYLSFTHPEYRKHQEFTVPTPPEFEAFLSKQRAAVISKPALSEGPHRRGGTFGKASYSTGTPRRPRPKR